MTVAPSASAPFLALLSLISAAALAAPAGHAGGHFSSGHGVSGHGVAGGHMGGHAAPAPRSLSVYRSPAVYRGPSIPRGAGVPARMPARTGLPARPIPGPVAGHPGAGPYGLRDHRLSPGFGRPARWAGGYWGGRYWPAVYYGPQFAWFLPSMPLYCATFWWLGLQYYYYNDVYYTWSPAAAGYVATDPPPVAAEAAPAQAEEVAVADSPAAPAPIAAFPDDHVFAYPTAGQSPEQQAQDRAECDRWGAEQARSAEGADFSRAVAACFEGRGYSAR